MKMLIAVGFLGLGVLLCFSQCYSQIIRVDLIRHKSPRHALLHQRTGTHRIYDRLVVPNGPKPQPTSDSIALSKYLDSEFYGEVKIGHPAQTFKVIFDTAWANAYVPSSKCSYFDPACLIHNKYDSSQSSTFVANGQKFHVTFPNNSSIDGFLSSDTIYLAHLTLKNFTFAEIISFPLDEVFVKADGVFGLAYDSLATGGASPFFYRLWKDGIIAQPVFSIYMNRDETTLRGGSLFLGGSDPKHYTGDFTFLPVNTTGYWQIAMDRLEVLPPFNTTFCANGCQVILDTSTTVIKGPKDDVIKLNKILSASKVAATGRYVVPCNTVSKLPEITLVFAGEKFSLKSDQYIQMVTLRFMRVCITAFVENDFQETEWVVGGAFMSKFYTEFNLERNTIGFALANI